MHVIIMQVVDWGRQKEGNGKKNKNHRMLSSSATAAGDKEAGEEQRVSERELPPFSLARESFAL